MESEGFKGSLGDSRGVWGIQGESGGFKGSLGD